jgi:hypothetical protein
MTGRFAELGLDAASLPLMKNLTANQRYKVMALMAESLGVECSACHEGKKYKLDTPQKAIARFMWCKSGCWCLRTVD